jgi:hypothetical protein
MHCLPPFASTDAAASVASVAGLNSNFYQTVDLAGNFTRQPAFYEGIGSVLSLRIRNGRDDVHEIRLAGRYQVYQPTGAIPVTSDGSLVFGLIGTLRLSPRSVLGYIANGALSTLASARAGDSPAAVFDPTSVRRTFWSSVSSVYHAYDLTPTLRWTNTLSLSLLGSLDDASAISGLVVSQRGIDYLAVGVGTNLAKEFTSRTTGNLTLRYDAAYTVTIVDLTQNPARDIGPGRMDIATFLVGHSYVWTPSLTSVLRAGATLNGPRPGVADSQSSVAPNVNAALAYVGEAVTASAGVSFGYTSINPRLGFGQATSLTAALLGQPSRRGAWKNFYLSAVIFASYAQTATSLATSSFTSYAGSIEARYGIWRWLGAVAGVDTRYVETNAQVYIPPNFRQIFYVGLAGYWTTAPTLIPLANFAVPIRPG